MKGNYTISQIVKKIHFLALIIILGSCVQQPAATLIIEGDISTDTTWASDTIYIISQEVRVIDGATLTIEPGTLIKANPGEYPNASMLIITKGAKINAVGTAEKPIVFTSSDDNITHVNQSSESLLNENNKGLWGGIIILGSAPISVQSGDTSTFYVGLDPNDSNSFYGGTQAEDNSGILKYVSIRFGGTYMGTGSESNGLTLCGVGNQTEIDQIEVFANQDDGVEFFGGTVNASNLLIYSSGDDGLDLDEGYTGKISNLMVVLGNQSDSGIEISGGKGTFSGEFSIEGVNLSVSTSNEDQVMMRIDALSNGTISSITTSDFLDVSKIQLQSTKVMLHDLSILKNGIPANKLSEIKGEGSNKNQVHFAQEMVIEGQAQGFDWTFTQQRVSL